jgi:uncharacterized membrane protein YjdF
VIQRVLLAVFAAVFIWSLVHPHDYFTWILEVFPAIIGLILIVAAHRRFQLTPLLLYELFEWRVAVASGAQSDAFLGTQGDPWDTQEDMATCLVGALFAPLLLGRWHDRQIERIADSVSIPPSS